MLDSFLEKLNFIVTMNHDAVVLAFILGIVGLVFWLAMFLLEHLNLEIYKSKFRASKKKIKNKKDVRLSNIPLLPNTFKLDINLLFFAIWCVVGLIGAFIGNDPMVSTVFLISMIGIGFAGYRGSGTTDYVNRRGKLVDIIRLFAGNLQTYQSVEESINKLSEQYGKMDEKTRDPVFQKSLKELIDLMNQGGSAEALSDRIFGMDKVYQQFSHIISIATHSGPANAVQYCRETIDRIGRWKYLVTLMNTVVAGVKLTALIMELLLVASAIGTLLPSWGSTASILHDYFFKSTQTKMMFSGILVAHTVVQFGFLEFLKIRSENI